jgi:hypothetical protein
VIAEAGFHVRDHGAFPHLNVYVPDERLGVRLRPGATERIVFGKNPVTSVRINGDGLRGAELPPAGDGEILVVGDSQVFGLGVEESQTASAELSRILGGRTVINAGVPTYGPPEYNAVAAELIAKRRPRTVLYVINMVNDLFEASHPNRERHRVWDGWAVRVETAPEAITSFPGREILFRRSHLVYALRSFLYAHGPSVDDQRFASEGVAADLVGAAARAGEEHARAARENEARRAERDAAERWRLDPWGVRYHAERVASGIVAGQGERVLGKGRAHPLVRTFEEHEALRKRLDALREAPAEAVRTWSPLTPVLREMKAACDAHGARLLVVALPMDLQVSKAEWTKYGDGAFVDMEPTKILLDDVVASAEGIGAAALDATPALAAAEPGAFLDGDIHMTPRGHRALAEALAAKLATIE